jgi:hypothetical protein
MIGVTVIIVMNQYSYLFWKKLISMFGVLNDNEIEQLIHEQFIGRIGCHADDITYVVPISYAYDGEYIYGRTYEGPRWSETPLAPGIEQPLIATYPLADSGLEGTIPKRYGRIQSHFQARPKVERVNHCRGRIEDGRDLNRLSGIATREQQTRHDAGHRERPDRSAASAQCARGYSSSEDLSHAYRFGWSRYYYGPAWLVRI